MRQNKRILSFLLALILVIGAFPIPGFAEKQNYKVTFENNGEELDVIDVVSGATTLEYTKSINPEDDGVFIQGFKDEDGNFVSPNSMLINSDRTFEVVYGSEATVEFSLWDGEEDKIEAMPITINFEEFQKMNEEYGFLTSIMIPKSGHFLIKALEKKAPEQLNMTDSQGDTLKIAISKNYIRKMFGRAELEFGGMSGWMYCVNDKYASVGLKEYPTTHGSTERWHYREGESSGEYAFTYTWFNEKQKTVNTGEVFELQLHSNGTSAKDAYITANGKTLEGKITDEDGKVSLSFDEPGEYYILSRKLFGGDGPGKGWNQYIPAYCKVTVTGETPIPERYDITITTEPADAAVVVTKQGGENPIEAVDGIYKLAAGEYTATVSAEGYESKVENFTVESENKTVTISLEAVPIAVDKSILQGIYNATKDIENDNYTEESWTAFDTARTEAKNILEDEKATENEVNNITVTLKNAWYGLKQKEKILWDGEGTEASPYLIQNIDDLNLLANKVNDENQKYAKTYFKLTTNIDLPKEWVSIGTKTSSFQGVLDGGNNTLNFSFGSQPLFGYSTAILKNINIKGDYIASSGIASHGGMNNGTMTFENVTIKEGTAIKKSGFVGDEPYESGVLINNCIIEKGVKIGWDAEKNAPTELNEEYAESKQGNGARYASGHGIGSFVGGLNGTITNSKSFATVYGEKQVGGIAGYKAYSMRDATIENCEFGGEVVATGELVGGILGNGYDNNSANTPGVIIKSCKVTGKVTGGNKVGGILGGENGLIQAWENGIGYIQNNDFTGTVKGTNGEYVGGIIGYMNSLNKYNIITNNTYLEESGATKGIGQVKYVDTNNPNVNKGDESVTYVNTENGNPGIAGMTKIGHNRIDDPLGVDADSLTKMIVSEKETYDITITTEPTDAIVVVTKKDDATEIEKVDGVYKLAAGDYTVTVSAEGYETKTENFTVGENQETSLNIVLEVEVEPIESFEEIETWAREKMDEITNIYKVEIESGNGVKDEWVIAELGKLGIKVGESDLELLKSSVDEATDITNAYTKAILALRAQGIDPQNYYGKDLVTELSGKKIEDRGLWSWAPAISALASDDYGISDYVNKEVTKLLASRKTEGADKDLWNTWGWSDASGFALYAIAPYYSEREDVKDALEAVVTALEGKKVNNDGKLINNNSNSLSVVLGGLVSNNPGLIKDERIAKDGYTLLHELKEYDIEGGFKWKLADASANGMATEQAYRALVSYFSMKEDKGSVFDYRGSEKTGIEAIKSDDATLKSLKYGNEEITLEADKMEYAVELPVDTTDIPEVTAEATSGSANVEITQATVLLGTATIVVTAEDGSTTKIYTVNFTVAEEPVSPVDKVDLANKIGEAEAIEKEKYTEESVATLETALTMARTVLGNNDATQEEVNEAYNNLQSALKGLESIEAPKPEANKNDLEKALQRAEAIDQSKYTSSTVGILQEAINVARGILRDEDVTQTQVDNAVRELTEAIDGLRERETSGGGSSSSGGSSSGTWNSGNTSTTTKPSTTPTTTTTTTQDPGNFIDISNHWAKTVIEYVVKKGYFNGIDSTRFAPNQPSTRGEFITVLGRLAKVDSSKYKDSKASDLGKETFYDGYANWAIQEGILTGYEDGTFKGDQTLTREEMAVFLHNTLKYMKKDLKSSSEISFTDGGEIATWAKDSIATMTANGYLKGRDGNKYDAKAKLTRAEIAQIIYNVDTK